MSGQGRGTPRVNPIATSAVVVGSVTANQGTAGASAWPVTSAQGTAGSLAGGWPVKITDGTNILGTALNPLRVTITSGTISGTVTANQGTAAALASAWPIKLTDGTNTMPTADVAARALFSKITDGTNTMPTADVAARAMFNKITDGTNTMPTADVASRAMFNKITDGTITITMGLQARQNSFPIVKKIESVRTSLTGTTGNTPGTQNTASVMGTVTGLDDYESFAVEATLAGTDGTAAGGPLDFVVQCSPDGTNWTDWAHFPTVASGDAAKTYRFVPTFSGTITQVTTETGTGTTISLGSGLSSGGHPGSQVRLKVVLGTAASPHAVAQTAFLIATRPAQS
jgi:hypothetical protein